MSYCDSKQGPDLGLLGCGQGKYLENRNTESKWLVKDTGDLKAK